MIATSELTNTVESSPAKIADDLIQTYLDFYKINFAKQSPDLIHEFGVLDLCGFRIATQYWLPANAKGTLVLVHGYYDHMGIYGKAIAFGLEQNFAILAFDLPGHGLSSGEKGVIDSFDQYADVLEALLQKIQSDLPVPFYALGQSTGSACLLNHLWRHEQKRQVPFFTKIALCSPLILPRGWATGRFLYAVLHPFVKKLARGKSQSSHDFDFIHFIDTQDPLQSKSLSIKWVGAMKAWHEQFIKLSSLTQSLLIVQGTDDRTVDWRYNLTQITAKLPNAKVHYVLGAGHQLVNESLEFRHPVFTVIREYFDGTYSTSD